MPELTIRFAEVDDVAMIRRLIEDLAEYEKLRDHVNVTEADLLRDGFGPAADRRFECLLAERSGEVVGFALFFPNFSTFEGRSGLYLEDLHVVEPHRGVGVGRALVTRLAEIAVERGCPRLDLAALYWNPARRFYEGLGFRALGDWRPYRLSGDALTRLAKGGAALDVDR